MGAAALVSSSTCSLASCLRITELPKGRNHVLFTWGVPLQGLALAGTL